MYRLERANGELCGITYETKEEAEVASAIVMFAYGEYLDVVKVD